MSTAERVLSHTACSSLETRDGITYRGNSPLRAGSDSGAFTLRVDDDEHGAYFDHVSGDSGSLYQLAAALGIETQAQRNSTRRDYLAEYAAAHNVSAAVFTAAGWSATTYTDNKIQYRALQFMTANGIRYRLFGTPADKSKYRHKTGYKRCWYRLAEALEIHQRTNLPLVYCNGEASVVVAQHRGIPAIAVCGGGERSVPAELLEELVSQYAGEILIAPDNDSTGRDGAPKVAEALHVAGLQPAILQLGLKEDKADLADYLKWNDYTDLYACTREAWPRVNTRTRVWRSSQEIAESAEIVAPPALITYGDSALLRKNKLYMLAGDPKIGKSMLCFHLAYCIASSAEAVLGSDDVYVSHSGDVLYLDLEQEDDDSKERTNKMQHKHPRLFVYTANDWTAELETNTYIPADELIRNVIEDWCKDHPERALVVVDNLSLVEPDWSMKKDRGLQERAWFTVYKSLAIKYGVSIILVEHTIKAKNGETSHRGTNQKRAATSGGNMTMEKTIGEIEASKGAIRFSAERRAGASYVWYLKYDTTLNHHIITAQSSAVTREHLQALNNERQAQLLFALEQHGAQVGADLALLSGLPRASTFRTLKALVEKRVLNVDKNGVYTIAVSTSEWMTQVQR